MAKRGETAPGAGWNLGTGGHLEQTMRHLRAENARRTPCPQCTLAVLDLSRHVRICHSDDP